LAKTISASKTVKTFQPGEAVESHGSGAGLSAEETSRIKAALAQAKTLEEMQILEKQLRAGHVPESTDKTGTR
jgi:hypothetical protein